MSGIMGLESFMNESIIEGDFSKEEFLALKSSILVETENNKESSEYNHVYTKILNSIVSDPTHIENLTFGFECKGNHETIKFDYEGKHIFFEGTGFFQCITPGDIFNSLSDVGILKEGLNINDIFMFYIEENKSLVNLYNEIQSIQDNYDNLSLDLQNLYRTFEDLKRYGVGHIFLKLLNKAGVSSLQDIEFLPGVIKFRNSGRTSVFPKIKGIDYTKIYIPDNVNTGESGLILGEKGLRDLFNSNGVKIK